MGYKLVLTYKNCYMTDEKGNVPIFSQGFSDHDKPNMVHDTSTLIISSIRIVFYIALVKGFRVFSRDLTQAYFQTKSILTRKVFTRPKMGISNFFDSNNENVF